MMKSKGKTGGQLYDAAPNADGYSGKILTAPLSAEAAKRA